MIWVDPVIWKGVILRPFLKQSIGQPVGSLGYVIGGMGKWASAPCLGQQCQSINREPVSQRRFIWHQGSILHSDHYILF